MIRLQLTIIFCILFLSSIAYAAENALQRTTDMAFQVLTPVVIIFATWLAHRLVKLFEKKTGIDVPAAQEAQIDGWIEQGIHYAEQKSRAKIKNAEDGLNGPDKLEHAADFVLSFIEAKKYPEWTRDLVKGKIEAKLGIKYASGEK